MGKEHRTVHRIDMVFPLLFLLFFGICAVTVTLQGARIYEKTTDGLQENYTVRTAVTYLQEKVREHSDLSKTEIQMVDGIQILVFTDEIAGEEYITCIYQQDGYLRELFCRKKDGIQLANGQELMPLDTFAVSKKGSFLYFKLMQNNKKESFCLRLYADGREKTRAGKE